MRRDIRAAVLVFVSMASVLAAADKVIVSVSSLPDAKSTYPPSIADYRVLKRFQELHPEIELRNAKEDERLPSEDSESALFRALQNGTAPDVIWLNFRLADTYIQRGFLAPLDAYVAEMRVDELAERVPDVMKPVVHRAGADGQQHWWAMPGELFVVMLQYRRDFFVKAGLDPDRPPGDWKQFKDYAMKVTNPRTEIYGTLFLDGEHVGWSLYPFLCSAGAQVMTRSPDEAWQMSFDSPEAVDAYEFAYDLAKTRVDKGAKSSPIVERSSVNGDYYREADTGIAMLFTYVTRDRLHDFDPKLIGIGLIPKGPTGKSSTEVNSRMLAIYARQQDPKVRRAAWEWIRFVYSEEARRVRVRTLVELDAWRTTSASVLKRFGFSELARQIPEGREKLFDQAVAQATPEPYGRNAMEVYKYLSLPFDEMLRDSSLTPDMPKDKRRARIQEILHKAVKRADEEMLGIKPE